MLTKLLAKTTGLSLTGRKRATVPTTPDISRVIKPPAQLRGLPATPAEALCEPMAAKPADKFHTEKPTALPEAGLAADFADKAEEAVKALTDSFDTWMHDDLAKLRAAWADALADQSSTEAYRELYTCAHNIRGAAGSYGYPVVSRLCGSLCALLGNSRPGENSALINMHIDACRAAVRAGPQGEGSQSVADQLCDALETRVAGKAAATG